MMRASLLSCAVTMGIVFSAHAEPPRCSDPTAVEAMAAAANNGLKYYFAVSQLYKYGKEVDTLRFPHGGFQVQFSDFVGVVANESSRNCSANVKVIAPDMKEAELRTDYTVSATEDGKVLVAPGADMLEGMKVLGLSYDLNNDIMSLSNQQNLANHRSN